MGTEGESLDNYLIESIWERFAAGWNEFRHRLERRAARQRQISVRKNLQLLRKAEKSEPSTRPTTRQSNQRFLQYALGGTTFGLALYFLMVAKLRNRVSAETCGLMAAYIGFATTLVISFSKHARASASLMLSSLIGSPMQNLLILFLFSAVLESFGRSALSNLEISIEIALCIKDKVGEQLLAIAEEMLRPLEYIQDRIAEIKEVIDRTISLMQQLVFALKQSTQVVLQMLTGAIRFLDNVVFTCDAMADPINQCWQLVHGWVTKCYQNQLSWSQFYMTVGCALIYFMHLVCAMMRAEIGAVCAIGSVVKAQLREQIINRLVPAVQNIASIVATELYVDVDIDRLYSHNQTVSHKLPELHNAIQEKFDHWELGFGFLLEFTHWLPFILLLWTIISSFRYISNFKSFLPFDNIYDTPQLRLIDRQRLSEKLESVFPLDPFGQRKERRKCILVLKPWPQNDEWVQLGESILILFVKLIPIGIALLVAWFCQKLVGTMTEAMGEVADAGTGGAPPHYTVKVEGRGFMAEIFRKLLDAISFGAGQKEGNETDAWQECLIGIEPQLISNDDYNIIIGMLFVIVVLCYLSMFQRRFQHRIAGHFYPDAAEARAAWKVGEIFMIRQQVRLQGSRFSLEHLQKGPQHLLFEIRNMTPMAKLIMDCRLGEFVNCIRCGCGGNSSDADNFRTCMNDQCGVHYCYFCFDQLPKRCCTKCGCKILQLSEVAGVEEEYFHWDNDSDDEQFVQLEEDNLQKEETKKQKHTETYDFGQYLEDLKTIERKTPDELQRIIQQIPLQAKEAEHFWQGIEESHV